MAKGYKPKSWSWSHVSLINNSLCNQCLSSHILWVRISTRVGCTTWCDKVYQWLATGRWFSAGTLVSSSNKTDRHDIAEILQKVALRAIKKNPSQMILVSFNSSTTDVTSGGWKTYTVHPDPVVFSGVRVVRSLVFCVVFCWSLLVLLSFFFWSLSCLPSFDLRFSWLLWLLQTILDTSSDIGT